MNTALQGIAAAVGAELLGGGAGGALDPIDAAVEALQRAVFERPAALARVAAVMRQEAGDARRTRRVAAGLERLAGALQSAADAGEPPQVGAWAQLVEFVATELSAEDLERDADRLVRLTATYRRAMRHRRRQRDPVDWSWEALSTATDPPKPDEPVT